MACEPWEMESEVGSGGLDNGVFWDGLFVLFSAVLSKGGMVLTGKPVELQMVISTPCETEDVIDNVLRGYLDLTVRYKGWSRLCLWVSSIRRRGE